MKRVSVNVGDRLFLGVTVIALSLSYSALSAQAASASWGIFVALIGVIGVAGMFLR